MIMSKDSFHPGLQDCCVQYCRLYSQMCSQYDLDKSIGSSIFGVIPPNCTGFFKFMMALSDCSVVYPPFHSIEGKTVREYVKALVTSTRDSTGNIFRGMLSEDGGDIKRIVRRLSEDEVIEMLREGAKDLFCKKITYMRRDFPYLQAHAQETTAHETHLLSNTLFDISSGKVDRPEIPSLKKYFSSMDVNFEKLARMAGVSQP